jgi:hypothetical protein
MHTYTLCLLFTTVNLSVTAEDTYITLHTYTYTHIHKHVHTYIHTPLPQLLLKKHTHTYTYTCIHTVYACSSRQSTSLSQPHAHTRGTKNNSAKNLKPNGLYYLMYTDQYRSIGQFIWMIKISDGHASTLKASLLYWCVFTVCILIEPEIETWFP